MSDQVGGFTVATVFDASGTPGRVAMGADHARLPAGLERARLLGYLRTAPLALTVLAHDADRVRPELGRVVPMSFRTDGLWVWSDQLAYYLDEYGYSPEPALLDHIRANDYRVPEVPHAVLVAAGNALR